MENLYCKNQKGNSKEFRENIENIKWDYQCKRDYSSCEYINGEGDCLLFHPNIPCLEKDNQGCLFGIKNDK